jgi:toxin ParE1/3/4
LKLTWTEEAAGDLDEIWDFSAVTWGEVQADRYLQDIRLSAKKLAEDHVSGTSESQIKPNLRRLVVRSHVIWFRVLGAELREVRVLHQSRDAGRWVE